MAAIEYNDSMYEIINLGNNQTVKLLELVKAIEEASGIIAKNMFGTEQQGDVKQTWADILKAQQKLSYFPKISIYKRLVDFEKWFSKGCE